MNINDLSNEFIKKIKKYEGDTQQKMILAYAYMDHTSMKDLRRIMPVTGNNFDWSGNMVAVN